MDKVISRDQTGFLKGRFMRENIRLVYHLMNNTEIKNISGLLILIDFEKAFDSTSWEFVFHALDLFHKKNRDTEYKISHFIETPDGILRELYFCGYIRAKYKLL